MKSKLLCALILVSCLFVFGCAKKEEPKTYGVNRIYIENSQFMVNGERIWMNGLNIPWDTFNDFGGTGRYDSFQWYQWFEQVTAAGGNSVRVWLHGNGYCNLPIDTNGIITPYDEDHRFWTDVDDLFELAEMHNLYIMATLLSFDHFNPNGDRNPARWRAMLNSNAGAQSFRDNFTIPFVERYKDNPWLWSIDIMNEPDWVIEEDGGRWRLESLENTVARLRYFFAINAAAIRERSDILVTVGVASVKYNSGSDNISNGGNLISDSALRNASGGNKNAILDFWSTHYYDWVGPWYGIPFAVPPTGTRPAGHGLPPGKPALIGECHADGSCRLMKSPLHTRCNDSCDDGRDIVRDYTEAFGNGWQGVLVWTTPGSSNDGTIEQIEPALEKIRDEHPKLVRPWE